MDFGSYQIGLKQLRRFFETHDAGKLFGSPSPSDGELSEFMGELSAGDIEEMLVEEYGEGIRGCAAVAIECAARRWLSVRRVEKLYLHSKVETRHADNDSDEEFWANKAEVSATGMQADGKPEGRELKRRNSFTKIGAALGLVKRRPSTDGSADATRTKRKSLPPPSSPPRL